VATGTRGSNQVTQIVLDITPREPEITRERRHAPRLIGEQFEEIAAKGHGATIGTWRPALAGR
jgi:hypothetical protein